MLTILEYTQEKFSELKNYWKQLECGNEMSAYQIYEWYEELNKIYPKEKAKNFLRKWLYLVIFEDDIPVMIAPLEIWKGGIGYKKYGIKKGCYFIGRRGCTDYLNFIYKDFHQEAMLYVLEYIRKKYGCKYFMFDYLPKDSSSYKFIKSNYCVFETEHCEKALFLPDDFEEYKKSLSKHSRQNIRTAINRQKKNNLNLKYSMVFDVDMETRKKLIEIRNQRLAEKKLQDRKDSSLRGRLYNDILAVYDKIFSVKFEPIMVTKNTWCFIVQDETRIVAFYWGIFNKYKNEYDVIWAGVDPEYAWYSPAISQFYIFLQDYYEQGKKNIKIFDFTRGGEKYKTDIGCIDHPASSVSFKLNK